MKSLHRSAAEQSRAEIDELGRCVFFHTGDKILLERQAGPLGVSGFILCSVWDGINQHQSSHVLPSENMLSLSLHSIPICFLSFPKPPSFAFLCVCLSSPASLYLPLSPSLSSLSLNTSFTSAVSFSILPHSFQPPPLRSSLTFPQEEPQSYLGYVGFGELKSHFTNSLCASPENSALS